MTARYTRRAQTDLYALHRHIASDNPSAAARVVSRIEEAVQRLGRHPQMGTPTDEPGVMRWSLTRFPYIIFYAVLEPDVVVLRIRHTARRPPQAGELSHD